MAIVKSITWTSRSWPCTGWRADNRGQKTENGHIIVDCPDCPDAQREDEYVAGEIIVKFSEGVSDGLREQLARGATVDTLRLSASLDRLTVKYRATKIQPVFENFYAERQRIENLLVQDARFLTPSERHLVRRLKRAPDGVEVPDLGRIYAIDLGLGQSAPDAAAEYSLDADVEYAELNYMLYPDATEPNDANYPVQWALANIGQDYPASGKYKESPGTPDCDIDANDAWDITTGSSDIIVGVIDTGVDYTHRDLHANIWIDANGYCGRYFFEDPNGDDAESADPMDVDGHGTYCAGIIAARGNNGLDTSGVSWNARIMALRFMDCSGGGPSRQGALAMFWATDNGADVLSCSYGGRDTRLKEDAVAYAHTQGVVVVASAGNTWGTGPKYPAGYGTVIAVAATDSNDNKPGFSTYGDWVELAAPGVDTLSLLGTGLCKGTHYGDYTTVLTGSSMSCPHVAGAAALILSIDPNLGPADVCDILMETVDVVFDPNDNICASNGRLNVYEAVLAAIPSNGHVNLDQDYYRSDCNIGIFLADTDLAENDTQDVNITTSGGDSETITLTEKSPAVGVFTGSISTASGDPNTGNDILEISHGQTIMVTYNDANDGSGSPASPNDIAIADCVCPVISDVNYNGDGPEPMVIFETNELVYGRVLYGLSCGGSYSTALSLGINHTAGLRGLSAWTDYYYEIEVTDLAGNVTTDDNYSNCYTFIDGPGSLNVPADYNSIQDAIENSGYWPGSTVTLAEGTYIQGEIDFIGKPLTLRSTDPNDWDVVANTIIDHNETGTVWFKNGEDTASVLAGVTVKNGSPGVYCWYSTPTIRNCIIEDCDYYGIWCCRKNCSSCLPAHITGNIVRSNGVGIISGKASAIIENNWVYNNDTGVLIGSTFSPVNVQNNTIVGNGAIGIQANSKVTPVNCIVWGNDSNDLVNCVATYSCIEDVNDANGVGNISGDGNEPAFVNMYDFHDVTDSNGTTTTVVVSDASLYDVNDVIEYADDAVVRTVTDVNTGTGVITFENALDSNSVIGMRIHNWGVGVTDVNEDLHLEIDSPCIDAGDPNGDYGGEVDIDGDVRVMCTVDIGADEVECFPSEYSAYAEWVTMGQPDCWCYCWEYQCYGDADGADTGDPNYYRVSQADLDLLNANWKKKIDDPNLNPCADIDHKAHLRGYRVYTGDLNILQANWRKTDEDLDPNCPHDD